METCKDSPKHAAREKHDYIGKMDGRQCTAFVDDTDGTNTYCRKPYVDLCHNPVPLAATAARTVWVVEFRRWTDQEAIERVMSTTRPMKRDMVQLNRGKFIVTDVILNYETGYMIAEVEGY